MLSWPNSFASFSWLPIVYTPMQKNTAIVNFIVYNILLTNLCMYATCFEGTDMAN